MPPPPVSVLAPVPTTRSFTARAVGTLPAGTVTVGSVASSFDTPAGSSGKFATGVATMLGLLVQPGAVVGTGGVGEPDPEALAAAESDALAVELEDEWPPISTTSRTTTTMTTTAAAELPITMRCRALARAAARSVWRRS